jgi:eukaryotic-like serine/threonine-protein kinase
MPPRAGTRLGPYEITALIGAGGMGEVWLATELRLGRKVALKLLPPDLTRDPSRILRFEQEARAASALNHPNVCTIYAFGETDEHQHYIAMEYVEGDTLGQRLVTSRLSIREALDIAIQVAAALSVAHATGIVHRDIKPENVMLRPDGVVKVLDFGLAKLAAAASAGTATRTELGVHTDPGKVVGTAAYMSPEQARGQQVDARTDIWSLGVMLYEMIAGRSPFSAPSGSDVLAAILQNEPAPVARFDPDATAEVQRILTKTLRKDRAQRYQTVQDLLLDLQALREELQSHARSGSAPVTAITAEPAPSSSGAAVVPSRRRRHVWLAVAAVVLVLATGLGVWTWRTARRAETPPGPTSGVVQRSLTRLTFAPGLQTDVTFSPDGRFIAYASDQGGNFDIWVQPAAGGGDPVQVTKSPAAETEPDWSPDGGQIVFRSERDGGGLFVVSALGGPERRLASFGLSPKWSPDGSRILFASAPTLIGGPGVQLFVVGLDGLPPRPVLQRFTAGVAWLFGWTWHPDGHRVSLIANRPPRDEAALYTVALDGASPVTTTLPRLLGGRPETRFIVRELLWAPSGTAIYFEISAHYVSNLWRLDIDASTLKAGSLVQLTAGAGQDTGMAVSRDGRRAALTIKAEAIRLWSYRLDPVTGAITGSAEPVTDPTMAVPATAALAPDGRQLAYAITGVGTGMWELWMRDLVTGQQRLLSRDNHRRRDPQWSRDSSRLAYQWESGVDQPTSGLPERSIAVRQPREADETLLATPKQQYVQPHEWSPDGNSILLTSYRPGHSTILTLWPVAAAPHADTAAALVTGDSTGELWQARFAPNGRWISFLALIRATAVVCVVPSSARNAREADWTCLTDPRILTDKPRWSSDGKLLYVWRRHGAFYNVWALPFDDARGAVAGPPVQITHLDSPAHRIWADDITNAEPSVSGTRMILPIAQATGSIWVLDNVDK